MQNSLKHALQVSLAVGLATVPLIAAALMQNGSGGHARAAVYASVGEELITFSTDIEHATLTKQSSIMSPRLHADPVARIDQQNGDIRGGRAGRHISRVLLVSRRIGKDEFATGRRKVPIGHVDGDPLFAFGAQTIGEEREIDRAGGPVLRRFLDRMHLIFVHRLRVVEQPSDERALPIVDAARRADAEKARHQK